MIDEKYFLKHEHYILEEFKFKSGAVLKDVDVDYGVVGSPKYDEEGNITNAILFCHSFEGNYGSISDFSQLIGQDAILTKDDYFFISITSLGFPGSCSPSTTGLNYEFPEYGIEDLVEFKKQFLSEKFPDIKKICGIVGYSFGGAEALAWPIFYPEDIGFVIHLGSSFKTNGYKYIFARIANQIIESSPSYYSDYYDESTSKVLINLSQFHYLISFTKEYFNQMPISEIEVRMDNFSEEGLFYDMYDIRFRNNFLINYDLEDQLDKIKCKVLIISTNHSAYYDYNHDALPLHNILKDSKLVCLDVKEETVEDSIYKIKEDIQEFFDSI